MMDSIVKKMLDGEPLTREERLVVARRIDTASSDLRERVEDRETGNAILRHLTTELQKITEAGIPGSALAGFRSALMGLDANDDAYVRVAEIVGHAVHRSGE